VQAKMENPARVWAFPRALYIRGWLYIDHSSQGGASHKRCAKSELQLHQVRPKAQVCRLSGHPPTSSACLCFVQARGIEGVCIWIRAVFTIKYL